MNYKTKNWKEDTEELYFGLKTAFNVFNLEGTYNQVNELWDIFEAAEYPVVYIKSDNELSYCLQQGILSKERLEKEKKPIVVLISRASIYEKLSIENLPLLYSTITAKVGKETRKVLRYIVENHTLEKTFEVQPDLVKAISREKNMDSVIKD